VNRVEGEEVVALTGFGKNEGENDEMCGYDNDLCVICCWNRVRIRSSFILSN